MHQQQQQQDLRETQLKHEEIAIAESNAKYIRSITDAIAQGRFDGIPQGQMLMKVMYQPIKDKIQEYYEAPLRGHTGKLRNLMKIMGTPEELAYIVLATMTRKVAYHNNNIQLSTLAKAIAKDIKKLHYFNRLEKDNPKLHAYLGHEYRRASIKRKEMLINKHIKSVYDTEDDGGADAQEVRLGVQLIDLVFQSGVDILVKTRKSKKKNKGKSAYYMGFSDEALKIITNMKYTPTAIMKPMVVVPKDWTRFSDGGYLSYRIPLVKAYHYKHRRHIREADYSKVYPIINKLQKTPWRVNKRVYDVVKHIYDNNMIDPRSPPTLPRLFGDLPTRDRIEVEDLVGKHKWVENQTPEQKTAYGQWNRKRERILIGLDGEVGRRLQFLITMKMAKEMKDFDKFWYVYTMDYRGRVYPNTDFLTPQSKGSTKAMLEFGEGRHLDTLGVYWLNIHTANTYGMDKEPLEDRVRWSISHKKLMLDIAGDPMAHLADWAYVDSPYEFLAACFAWKDYHEGKVIHLPIQLDAVNSGVQFYSGLLLDKEGAEATCVIGNVRSDLYQKVADRVNEKLLKGEYPKVKTFFKSDGTEETLSTQVEAKSLQGKITRSMTKTNVMTVPYSVTHRGMKMQNWEVMDKMEREGKKFWEGDDWIINYLWTELTYESIFEIVQGARIGQEYLRALSDVKRGQSIWTTPMYGVSVMQPAFKAISTRVQTPLGTLEIPTGTDKYNRAKDLSSIAANYIHSLDSTLLMYCVEHSTGYIGVIHDCFLVHPNDGNEIRTNYKEGYIKLMGEKPLEMISKELDPEGTLEVPCIGTLDLEEVRDSIYIIS